MTLCHFVVRTFYVAKYILKDYFVLNVMQYVLSLGYMGYYMHNKQACMKFDI